MKSRTVTALALVCTWTWAASAGAGGPHSVEGDRASSVEVETPVSANESGPWLAGKAHRAEGASSAAAVPENRDSSELGSGASSGTGGSGRVGSDPLATSETTEYWLIGSEDAQSGVGASASGAAGGSGSFDSSAKGPDG